MTAASMDQFVRELFSKTTDLSLLTHRFIRDKYVAHVGSKEEGLSTDNRTLLKQIVEVLIQEKMENETTLVEELPDHKILNKDAVETKKSLNYEMEAKKKSSPKEKNQKAEKRLSVEEALEAITKDETDVVETTTSSSEGENGVDSDSSQEAPKKSNSDEKKQLSNNSARGNVAGIKKSRTGVLNSSNSNLNRNGSAKASPTKNKRSQKNCTKPQKKRQLRVLQASSDEDSEDNDNDDNERTVKNHKRAHSGKDEKENGVQLLNSDDELPLSVIRQQDSTEEKKSSNVNVKSSAKATNSKKRRRHSSSSAGSDDDIKSKQSVKPNSKQKIHTVAGSMPEKDGRVLYLEKIARHCGAMPRGRNSGTVFADCHTSKQRCQKLEQILRDAGMTGQISMKAAERLKLDKEVQELNQNNVLGNEGRTKRNVVSMFSRHEYVPVPHDISVTNPVESLFSNLNGIISDDDSSSN